MKRRAITALVSCLGFCSGASGQSGIISAAAGAEFQPSMNSFAQKTQLVESYGRLPLSFEANTGQADKSVKFLSRGSGYGLYLTGAEAVLALQKGGCAGLAASAGQTASSARQPGFRRSEAACPHEIDVVRMRLAGADSGAAAPTGEERLSGTANYFIGKDAARWHSSAPTYAKVRYRGVYPGVDLVYYGNQRQLEYDFVVAPGADPKPIRLRFAGAKGLRLDPDGDLVVTVADGAMAFHKPVVYQVVDGQRKAVEGGYRLLAKNTVGFHLGRYDRGKALAIDPVLVYSTYLGGTWSDSAYAIAADATGNVYVAGQTLSLDFPLSQGALQTKNRGGDSFVTKLNPSGSALVYSTYVGGSGYNDSYNSGGDIPYALAVDASGNAYIAGKTTSVDFPVTQGAFQTTNHTPGNGTAFVAKLNPTGSALVYSTYLGGSGWGGDSAAGLAVDGSGNAYVAGTTWSSDFPVTPGAFQTTNHGPSQYSVGSNAFVAKLNPAGSALVYSTYLGGTGLDYANALAVDGSGNAYVTGYDSSIGFPVTNGAFQTTNRARMSDGSDAFVAKLNPTGSALIYSTFLGGSNSDGYDGESSDIAYALAVDGSGNAYIAGCTISTDFPVTPGAFQTTNHAGPAGEGNSNAFVTKLNPAGTALVYSTYLGGKSVLGGTTGCGNGGDQANGLAVDGAGNAYITGYAGSTDFPVTQGAFQTTNLGAAKSLGAAFVAMLNPAGTALVYSTYLGGTSGAKAFGLALDGAGNAYVAGQTISTDFPATQGAFKTKNSAYPDATAFVAKLNLSAATTAPTVTVSPSASSITTAQALTVRVTVSGPSGGATPTGWVTLSSGSYTSVPATLSGGTATVIIPAGTLAVGTDVVTASFSPDGNSTSFGSASGTATVLVTILAPTVTVTPSASSITTAQPLSVLVAVSGGTGNPTPTGSVTLSGGGFKSPATALSGGTARITIAPWSLAPGSDVLTASYTPDTASSKTFSSASGSSPVSVTAALNPVPTVTVKPFSSVISTAQTLTVMVTVGGGSGNPTPTGSATLISGSYASGAITLSGGSASFNISAGKLATGSDTLTVNYTPDTASSSIYQSASGTGSVTVTAAAAGALEWTWMGGSSTAGSGGQPGVYGTLGTPAAGNIPGSRQYAVSWTDKSGNLWLFGGNGYDVNGKSGYLNDLWEFSPSTNQWAWMGGSNTVGNCTASGSGPLCAQPGVYGTMGTPAAGNTPGSREYATNWTDGNGRLWLFGGLGYDAAGTWGFLNDLWEFTPSTNKWAWMGGSSTSGGIGQLAGVYGKLGTPAAGNFPGGREAASSWTDTSGHLWLFGGYGSDSGGHLDLLNDLWEFNPSTNQWAWMSGGSTLSCSVSWCAAPGAYGTLGIPAAGNLPGGREYATSWIDRSGNLWLFGGFGSPSDYGSTINLNDLWEFSPSTNQWAWMGGGNTVAKTGYGVYGTLGIPAAANVPSGRRLTTAWTGGGNLWLFGGQGNAANSAGFDPNDLWEFSTSMNQWAWMGGSNTGPTPGVYGALGTPAAGNIPGSRWGATSWTDSSGNFWLFGGYGFDAKGNWAILNDLWSYQPSAALPPAPSITPGGIVPVGSTVATIQPGEWASIYGTNLASSTVTWAGDFPQSLGGTSVTIDGRAAYLSLVSPGQINLQTPYDTATGSVPVVVTTAGGSATSTVTLAQFGPSFFLLDAKHVAGIILRANGSGAYGGGTYDILGPTGTSLGYGTVAAKAGDTIELFATGLGPTNPAVPVGQAYSGAAPTTNAVTLRINNVSLVPDFTGLSGAGLFQINLTVPAGLGTGDVSLVATVGGVQTPAGAVISLQ